MANNEPAPAGRPVPATPPLPPQVTRAPSSKRGAHRPPGRFGRLALVGLLGGLIGALLTVGALGIAGVFSDPEPVPTTTTAAPVPVTVQVPVPVPAPTDGTAAVTAIAELARPSIVTVEVGNGDGTTDLAEGSGSGVVFESGGYLLTNNHVVEDAQFVRVIFLDGRIYQAEVVGTDPLSDIAVLRVGVSNLTPIEIAEIDSVQIGDPAIAIGNPLGLGGGPSVTSGIVSAFNRELQVTAEDRLFGLIQTDAPITRGSSGGALLDKQGRLIGITTAIGVSDVGAEGLGFAVPVDTVVGVARDLMESGEVQHAFLGITGEDAFDVTDDDARVPAGARIFAIEDPSAIATAGAEVGDTIVALDGKSVNNMSELVATLRSYRAGETIDVAIRRGDEQLTLTVVLDRRPEGL